MILYIGVFCLFMKFKIQHQFCGTLIVIEQWYRMNLSKAIVANNIFIDMTFFCNQASYIIFKFDSWSNNTNLFLSNPWNDSLVHGNTLPSLVCDHPNFQHLHNKVILVSPTCVRKSIFHNTFEIFKDALYYNAMNSFLILWKFYRCIHHINSV